MTSQINQTFHNLCLRHNSPRRLAGEKKVPAIIIKQQFGFPMSTTPSPCVTRILVPGKDHVMQKPC